MNVQVLTVEDKDNDFYTRVEIYVNGKERIWIGDCRDYPEDYLIERNLNFVYDISTLMKEAYEAGKAGEELNIVESTEVIE